MNQLLKKKLLVLLLFICCLLSTGLLLNTDFTPDSALNNLKQVDSLILKTLYKYGAVSSDISSYDVEVDSTFGRKVFKLTAAKKFPQTKVHIHLNKIFEPYHFSLPGRVLFPEKDLRIYFIYKGTILRTLLIVNEEQENI